MTFFSFTRYYTIHYTKDSSWVWGKMARIAKEEDDKQGRREGHKQVKGGGWRRGMEGVKGRNGMKGKERWCSHQNKQDRESPLRPLRKERIPLVPRGTNFYIGERSLTCAFKVYL